MEIFLCEVLNGKIKKNVYSKMISNFNKDIIWLKI